MITTQPKIQNNQRIRQTTSEFPSRDRVVSVAKQQLNYLDNLTYTTDLDGNLHFVARIIPDSPLIETDGEFDQKAKMGLVEIERFANDHGFEFWLHRVTAIEAAHRTSDNSVGTLGKLKATVIFGTFKPTKKATIAKATTETIPYQFTPESHKEEIELYEKEVGAILSQPEFSTKGYGFVNDPFLCPNFRPGIQRHDGLNTTWEDFAAMLVTHSASIFDRIPEARIYTRASLQKGDVEGIPQAKSKIEFFAINGSMKIRGIEEIDKEADPVKRREVQNRLRLIIDKIRTVDRKRLPDGTLEPYKIGMKKITSLADPELHNQLRAYECSRLGAQNRESGSVLHRIVVVGETPGVLGDISSGLPSGLQMKRAQEVLIDHIEQMGEDLTLTESEKEQSSDYQRQFNTFTISIYDGIPNFSGKVYKLTPVPSIVIQSPGKEKSILMRHATVRMPNGQALGFHIDPETGYSKYNEPYSENRMYEIRDARNIPAAKGVSGRYGKGGKWLSSEPPHEMDMSLEISEMLHVIRYANNMGPDFALEAYAADSVMVDIQSLGDENHGLKRLLLLHLGKFKKIHNGEKPAPKRITGYKESTLPYSEAVRNELLATNYEMGVGFGSLGKPFEIARDKNHFPGFDINSPFYKFMEARYYDSLDASKVEWVNGPLKFDKNNAGKTEAGYFIFKQYAGIDYELPMHGYLLYFLAGVSEIYDSIYEDARKAIPDEYAHLRDKIEVSIHQTDLVRSWDEYYKFLRMTDDVKNSLSSNCSESFTITANRILRNKGIPIIAKAPDLDVSFNSELCLKIYKEGIRAKEIVDSYHVSALDSYRLKLLQLGISTEDVVEILEECRIDKQDFYARIEDDKINGKNRKSYIKETYDSAITFLFGIQSRVRITWPKISEAPNHAGTSNSGEAVSNSGLEDLKLPERLVSDIKPTLSEAISNGDQTVLAQEVERIYHNLSKKAFVYIKPELEKIFFNELVSTNTAPAYATLSDKTEQLFDKIRFIEYSNDEFKNQLEEYLNLSTEDKNKLDGVISNRRRTISDVQIGNQFGLRYLMGCIYSGKPEPEFYTAIFSMSENCKEVTAKSKADKEIKSLVTRFLENRGNKQIWIDGISEILFKELKMQLEAESQIYGKQVEITPNLEQQILESLRLTLN